YKKVANKIRPVATTLPEAFRIKRHYPEDPLTGLKDVPKIAPPFVPTAKFTIERHAALDIHTSTFLTPDEIALAVTVLANNENALAWNELEKGRFRNDYFDPVVIPTIEHVPWAQKTIPIAPGILPEVIDLLKEKIAAGVYETSDASYRSGWFVVKKKN
ncbi:hypothetical protein BD410DRAFT_704100, partial [Rickenella mellea]